MNSEERILLKMRELEPILQVKFQGDNGIQYLAKAMDATQEDDGFDGKNHSNTRNDRLAVLGDAFLDFVIVDILFKGGLAKGEIEPRKQSLVNNKTQYHFLFNKGIQHYFYNDQGFLGDPDIDQPTTSYKSIPYLEAIIGALYLCNGMEYCRSWILDYVYPGLKEANQHSTIMI